MKSAQHNLAKIHKQWFIQETDKKKILKEQPEIIQRVKNDFNKLEDLANERVSLAEEALKLVDRHLNKLKKDLERHDRDHPDAMPLSQPTHSYTIPHEGSVVMDLDMYSDRGDEEEEEEEEEESEDEIEYKVNQKRMRRDETDNDERLYCFCQQVSYGDMVACDGQNCPYEWFHMECVGLKEPPKGSWYCPDCSARLMRHKRKQSANPLLTKRMKKRKDSHV
ncbi:hypothetical protein G6F57_003268 [Rhizopus arrhizus]|uniref:Chromatin modification-related protein YNG2 n=1 Tax=Rhizopus oryzae TaxID=64495 RepID=A0A9P6XFZ2_RHIOR|nr:hypothetical protein G6F23_001452 [Rhizopus arrhizus]KAG1425604.1 hypothetical protein G6F58_001847 [Rhizopus delemar]KAG0766487.1 hypothetical protein G6F24_003570 [Rhizopus arrhizus]KAG0793983.1 hypothetical protein G6F21_003211 [Rhizopus arrhizus]KAG0802486.1 hypothetical protein G6F22_000212 [Rhizopus arrhizus]